MSQKTKKPKISASAIWQMLINFVRCNQYIWREYKWYLIALVAQFSLIAFLPFAQSGANALLINKLVAISTGSPVDNEVYYLLVLLVLSNSLPPIIYSFEMHISRIFYFFLERKFDIGIVEKLSTLDIASHENPKKKDLISKVGDGGVYRLQNFVDRQFYIIQSFIELIIAFSILAYADFWILIIIAFGTIPGLINELRYGWTVWNIWSAEAETRRRYTDLRYRFQDIGGLIEMKLFQNAKHFIKIIYNLFDKYQSKEIKTEKVKLRLELVAKVISQITFGIAIVFYTQQVITGQIQIGTFTFIIASISAFKNALSGLSMGLGRQYQDNLFVSDTFALLDLEPVITSPANGIKITAKKIKIEFIDVWFKYPETKKYILKNFNLTINSGDKIAIIGVNGAGKTTLIKLLCRFYDPTQGKILINGVDLKTIDLESWYSHMGAIFQDFERYYFEIKKVISLGRSDKKINLRKVKQAARFGEANVFIEEWEKNYDQMLGKHFTEGIEPSIGQWQKISLARTFYRNPDIMILDEPTASIDAESEAKIFDRIHDTSTGKTVIIISHRFSTVRNADKIRVIKNGRLTEYGTHRQLLKNKKTYARLFNLQAKGYK